MRVDDNDSCTALLVLEQTYDGDMILDENTIEHIVGLLEVRSLHGCRAEFHEMVLDQRVSGGFMSTQLMQNKPNTHFDAL